MRQLYIELLLLLLDRCVDLTHGNCSYLTGCPSVCHCQRLQPIVSGLQVEVLIIDCSNRNLSKIPSELPYDTTDLILRGNKINFVSGKEFRNCHIVKMDLAENNISTVSKDFSKYLGNTLEELYLNNNRLNISEPNSLPPGVFRLMIKLEILTLQKNLAIGETMITYRNDVFSDLHSLRKLAIDAAKNISFGEEFENFTNLESLDVYDGLSVLWDNLFYGLRNCPLKSLKISSRDSLYDAQQFVFAPLRFLESLDLSYNDKLGLDNASKAWLGLSQTNITTLILSKLTPRNQQYVPFQKSFIAQLQETRIKKLHMDKNNIITMQRGVAEYLPHLEELNLSYNRLSNIESLILDTGASRNLVFVDFSYQDKRYVYPQINVNFKRFRNEHTFGIFRARSSNEYADRVHYNSSEQYLELPNCDTKEWIPCKFPSNFLTDAPVSSIETMCFPLPPKLEVINMSQSLTDELSELPQIFVLGGRHLRYLEFKKVQMKKFTGPLVFLDRSPNNPLAIDASENGIECLAKDIFKISFERGLNLTQLKLSQNKLGNQLEMDSNGSTFYYYRTLQYLSLSKNGIKSLPENVFQNLTELITLNLSGNSLRLLNFKGKFLSKLKYLDLSNNLISMFDESKQQDINFEFPPNMTIDLYENPLECSCESLSFLYWLVNNKLTMHRLEEYTCFYNGTITDFRKLRIILETLSYRCSLREILISSLGLLAAMMLIVSLSLCIYRHKWDIRFCWIRYISSRDRYRQSQDNRLDYIYDAFISHHSSDTEFVVEQLMKHLEGEDTAAVAKDQRTNFRLCVHQRDFLPGSTIEDNIVTAIDNSRKTILVVSDNFISSNWCEFELQMARFRSWGQGRNVAIVILLPPINIEKITSTTLKYLISRNTYLEWDEDQSKQEEFWSRLRQSLNSHSQPYITQL